MLKVGARNTFADFVDNDIADDFLNEHHRQGATRSSKSSSIGLFHVETNELLGVIQFCFPRTSSMKELYSAELLRLVFKTGVRVSGGASKLIKFYIEKQNPSDFFTYQDTSGENTLVYQHAGMTLVKDGVKTTKDYLVAPGKTLETASRKEALGMAYATRYGPDRILGTSLGEIFRADGSRKSNKQIFLEDLGWHIETTSGDSIWEWVNKNQTFYTYKITASDSNKYYYGVSHVKVGNATREICLNDGYWGSGSDQFKNWRNRHKSTLLKEIVGLHARKSDAHREEKTLIGDKWKTDSNCLNSIHGGMNHPSPKRKSPKFIVKDCSEHGSTKHYPGGSCKKCVQNKALHVENCEIHGDTKFQGEVCVRCALFKPKAKVCEIHGPTLHIKTVCLECERENPGKLCVPHGFPVTAKAGNRRCGYCVELKIGMRECKIHKRLYNENDGCFYCRDKRDPRGPYGTTAHLYERKKCSTHGQTAYENDECVKCSRTETVENCVKHGETDFLGGKCRNCIAESRKSMKTCETHGVTLHRGDSCYRCASAKNSSLKVCDTHGETLFSGDACMKCAVSKVFSMRVCSVHGKTNFRGDTCVKCQVKSHITLKVCPTHGETRHQGDVCARCVSENAINMKICAIHGETKFFGSKCASCRAEAGVKKVECPTHGLSTSIGDKCRLCVNQKAVNLRECPRHGLVKHQGEKCSSCSSMTIAHRNYHGKKPNPRCFLCVENAHHVGIV